MSATNVNQTLRGEFDNHPDKPKQHNSDFVLDLFVFNLFVAHIFYGRTYTNLNIYLRRDIYRPACRINVGLQK
jgi:hypothetical protein